MWPLLRRNGDINGSGTKLVEAGQLSNHKEHFKTNSEACGSEKGRVAQAMKISRNSSRYAISSYQTNVNREADGDWHGRGMSRVERSLFRRRGWQKAKAPRGVIISIVSSAAAKCHLMRKPPSFYKGMRRRKFRKRQSEVKYIDDEPPCREKFSWHKYVAASATHIYNKAVVIDDGP